MASLSGVAQGLEGYLGVADESIPGGAGTPGTFVAPSQFLLAEDIKLDSVPAMTKREVMAASRDADRSRRTTKYKVGGAIQMGLYPSNGVLFLAKSLGKVVPKIAIVSDTFVSYTVLDGMVTAVLTTGAGTYDVGRPILLDDGSATQEPAMVASWDSGTKTLVFPEPTFGFSDAATVTAPAADLFTPFTTTDGHPNVLGTVSVEENLGQKYAWQYAGGLVGKYDLKATATKVDATIDLSFNKQRVLKDSATWTEFDESDESLSDLSFEFIDGYMAFPLDQHTDANPGALQRVDLAEDWSIGINNNLIERGTFDGSENYRYFPGKREVALTWKYLNEATRPVAWTDFLRRNISVPWFAQLAQNQGDYASPLWQIVSFHAPNVRYQKATEIRGVNELIGEDIQADALRAGGEEKLQIWHVHETA